MWWRKWLALALAMALLLGTGWMEQGQAAEPADRGSVSARLILDGADAGAFSDVTGLDTEYEVVELVCPVDGPDDDCDGTDSVQWEADVRLALWDAAAAAAAMEGQAWHSTRAKHDAAANAIRNMKALIARTEDALNQPVSLRGRHDTVKNAIGNIRAAFKVISTIAIDETGVHRALVQSLESAVDRLTGLGASYRVHKRPGRPSFGNITLSVNSLTSPVLLAWLRDSADGKAGRKSGSIIFLDRSGQETARFHLTGVWLVRHSASLTMEKIEIAVEKVERMSR